MNFKQIRIFQGCLDAKFSITSSSRFLQSNIIQGFGKCYRSNCVSKGDPSKMQCEECK